MIRVGPILAGTNAAFFLMMQLQASKDRAVQWADAHQLGRFDAADAVSHAAVDLSLQLSALGAAVSGLHEVLSQTSGSDSPELGTEDGFSSQEHALRR